ncbi:uncharacterized protein LOC143017740 isoform X10 [Oratosquilla oratoria]|uniref:uncharacterized protein LOC143017740 isoform X10 n=1 Tax=Oratosquilla oratoria TaxID=337810 RepID=UPI003F75BFE2
MMRGPSYDDAYISRKLSSFQSQPTYAPPPPPPSYGRYMQYRRARSLPGYRVYFNPGRVTEVWYMPGVRARTRFVLDKYRSSPHTPYRSSSPPPSYYIPKRLGRHDPPPPRPVPTHRYLKFPSPQARVVMKRIDREENDGMVWNWAYPPMGPPRLPPRMVPVPSYYDYDYPYAGGYGGYTSYLPPPVPRMSRYDAYLDDDLDVAYQPRYRPRVADSLDAIDTREKSAAMTGGEVAQLEELRLPRAPKGAQSKEAAGGGRGGQRALPPSSDPHALGAAEDNKRLHRLSVRYPSLSDAQMLQDHVDKMRIRLKSLAYSLDPTGPVPEIVIPGRSKRSESAEPSKKYSMGPRHLACVDYAGRVPLWKRRALTRFPPEDPHHLNSRCKAIYEAPGLDYAEMPRLSTRKQRYYPEDEHMKDNLRIKCLSHYKTTRNAAGYCKAKQYVGGEVLPETYTGSYKSKYSSTKWEEPDTVFSGPSDKKPFSKAITDVPTEDTKAEEEPKEEKKERRKKKKSKERDEAPAALEASAEAASAAAAASPAPATESEPAPVEEAPKVEAEPAAPAPAPTAAADAPPAEEEVLDEKERKKLEKKRRKAEREAAAKAAMEAELAALAAAEAELARLEAESASIKVDAAPSEPAAPAEAAPAATTEAAPEAKSESAADKSKSTRKFARSGN